MRSCPLLNYFRDRWGCSWVFWVQIDWSWLEFGMLSGGLVAILGVLGRSWDTLGGASWGDLVAVGLLLGALGVLLGGLGAILGHLGLI